MADYCRHSDSRPPFMDGARSSARLPALAQRVAATAKLRDHIFAAPHGDVIDAAAPESRALNGRRGEDVAFANGCDEADVGTGGDGGRTLAVARAREGGVGQHEHVPAVADGVAVEHLKSHSHLYDRSAGSKVQQFHAEPA